MPETLSSVAAQVTLSLPWVGFVLFILLMLSVDLLVFHKRSHEVSFREALSWTAVWIGLSLGFTVLIYYWRGRHLETALTYLTGYLIEWSLSVDNLFVFLVIFSFFRVERIYQHRVLFWGIVGALVMRAVFIATGVELIHRFHWIIYVFGAFLVYTGVKLVFHDETKVDPERNIVLRLCRRFLPIADNDGRGSFIVRKSGKLFATPLLIVLLVVETTDLMFALDSIPAILSITQDTYIVYTSNVFAILGLRALFFVLERFMKLFHYLSYGLAVILVFVGVKMLISKHVEIPVSWSLGVVLGVLAISVVLSVFLPPANRKNGTSV